MAVRGMRLHGKNFRVKTLISFLKVLGLRKPGITSETFMKYLFENSNNYNTESESDLIEIKDETKLKIYEIISLSYIRVNGGIDTLLQLCGCISKIFI